MDNPVVIFLLGVIVGVFGVLLILWRITKLAINSEQKKENKDDWWKNGEPPPY